MPFYSKLFTLLGASLCVSLPCAASQIEVSGSLSPLPSAEELESANWYVDGDLLVGDVGKGSLVLRDSAFVSSWSSAIGARSGSVGSVLLEAGDWGAPSWSTNNLFLGGSREGESVYTGGRGALELIGGSLSSNDAYIGYGSGSFGSVSLASGDWGRSYWNTGSLVVGGSDIYLGDVPAGGTGTLSITGGSSVSSWGAGMIGHGQGATGDVTVSGIFANDYGRSEWTVGNLTVGGSNLLTDLVPAGGSGTLNITDGGKVSSQGGMIGRGEGATGDVTVSGASAHEEFRSEWDVNGRLIVGGGEEYYESGGTGTLRITDGGRVVSQGGVIGLGEGSTGAVTVSGMSAGGHYRSEWEVRYDLTVGGKDNSLASGGTGTLSITDGGKVSSRNGFIGRAATGDVTVSGTSANGEQRSEWEVNGELVVGDRDWHSEYVGIGTLSITDGGKVSSLYGVIGQGQGSRGDVTVSGVSASAESDYRSEWNIYDRLSVGGNSSLGNTGTGTLTITDGGLVTSPLAYIHSKYPDAASVVTVSGSGSEWLVNNIHIGSSGAASGQLLIEDGGVVSGMNGNGVYGNGVSLSVGGYRDSRSLVSVSGKRSLLNGDYIFVGNHSDIVVADGGSLWSETLDMAAGSTLTLDGGFLRLNSVVNPSGIASALDYRSGTVQFGGDRQVGQDSAIASIFGETLNLGAGRDLRIEQTALLQQEVILDGGTFGFNRIENRELLDYRSGSIFLFGDRSVGLDDDINYFYRTAGDLVLSEGKGLFIEGMARLRDQIFLHGGTLSARGITSLIDLTFVDGTLINSGQMSGAIDVEGQGTIIVTGKDARWDAGNSIGLVSPSFPHEPREQKLSLLVEDGGTVVARYVDPGLTGMVDVTVTGAGSLLELTDREFFVSGRTKFSVFDGGTLKTGRVMTWPDGLVMLDGGTVDINGGDGTDWLNFLSGTLINRGMFFGRIAMPDQGLVIMSGRSATWNSSVGDGSYLIGAEGREGTLRFEDGARGQLYGETFELGVGEGSVGRITVTGVSSLGSRSELGAGEMFVGTVARQGDVGVGTGGTGILRVEDGALVNARNVYIGNGEGAVGDVTISGRSADGGPRSELWVDGLLAVGYADPFTEGTGGTGTLTVRDGGLLSTNTQAIGHRHGSVGTVTVDGTGSELMSNYLFVGSNLRHQSWDDQAGTGTLLVSGGASASAREAEIGHGSGTGTVTVSGGDAENASTFVTENLRVGGGYFYSSDDEGPSGSGTLVVEKGGRVTVGGGYSSDGFAAHIGDGGAASGTVIVTGAGSELNVQGGIAIGTGNNPSYYDHPSVGTLTVSDGGKVSTRLRDGSYGTLLIGDVNYDPNIKSLGTVIVSGRGSRMEVGELAVGSGSLLVADGGVVSSASSNIRNVTVTGQGSEWNIAGNLTLEGRNGFNSELLISDGGRVATTASDIGYYRDAGNVYISHDQASEAGITVIGEGSELAVGGALYVAVRDERWDSSQVPVMKGALTVADGGIVSSGDGYIGYLSRNHGGNQEGAMGLVTVTGSGSSWIADGTIYVGGESEWLSPDSVGYNGTLQIENGGFVSSHSGVIGGGYDYSNYVIGYTPERLASVSGAGSLWEVRDSLEVGAWGVGKLQIRDGGAVTSGTGAIGGSSMSYQTLEGWSSEAVVSGSGSRWDVLGGLSVGFSGGHGTLVVEDGGHVTSGSAAIGYSTGGSQNDSLWRHGVATVTGAGSQWQVVDHLQVGADSGNSVGALTISDGGSVTSTTASINGRGLYTTRPNAGQYRSLTSTITVSGSGSELVVRDLLSIGSQSTRGQLVIEQGASVSSGSAAILNSGRRAVPGRDNTSTAFVRGAGTQWNIDTDLRVGANAEYPLRDNPDSILDISDGANVTVGQSLTVGTLGVVNIQVGQNVSLNVGQTLRNDGSIRLTAAPSLAAGEYTPIVVQGAYAGQGEYKAFGGIWNNAAKRFIVSAAIDAVAGEVTTVDLSQTQRLEIAGETSRVAVAFDASTTATDGGSAIDFVATENSVSFIAGEAVLSAWDFTTNMSYSYGTILTFNIGGGWFQDMLSVWHSEDGTSWVQIDVEILYDGDTVSFLTQGFSSYAVSAVPEPATYAMILSLLAVGLVWRLRRR